MKKRLLSILTALALCLTLLPMAALAEEGANAISVCGETWAASTYAKTASGAVTTEGAGESDYSIYWDAATSTLTLHDAAIDLASNGSLDSIVKADLDALTLHLVGTNTIKATISQAAAFAAISNRGTIDIDSKDGGSLSIELTQTVDSASGSKLTGIYTETGLTNHTDLSISI